MKEKKNYEETSTKSGYSYNFEFVTLKNLLLGSNFRKGGILLVNALKTNTDNCYLTHFVTNGNFVRGDHETYIQTSFLDQHITAGGDPGEGKFLALL